jgi:hypothetical protein
MNRVISPKGLTSILFGNINTFECSSFGNCFRPPTYLAQLIRIYIYSNIARTICHQFNLISLFLSSLPMKTSYSRFSLLLDNTLYIYLSNGRWYKLSKGYMIIVYCNNRREDDINSYDNK